MLRIINWNISCFTNEDKNIEYLKSLINEVNGEYPCIIALQEVRENAYMKIKENMVFSKHAYSLLLREPGRYDERTRKLGCFIGIVGDVKIVSSSLIDRAPFPERTLSVDINYKNMEFELLNFYSLTGIHYGKAKSGECVKISDSVVKEL
jgi:hypothetical protein